MKKAVVLWTGGKDSALAYYETKDKYDIVKLVTFVPEHKDDFMAHPLVLMRTQAESMGVAHECITVGLPYKETYINGLTQLINEGVEVVVTGDISLVHGNSNWIEDCCEGLLEVDNPLWEHNRAALLKKLQLYNFEVICSLSYKKHFNDTITGRYLDDALISELISMEAQGLIDACGENGEYHSCVLNAPFFENRVVLDFDFVDMPEYISIKIKGIHLESK